MTGEVQRMCVGVGVIVCCVGLLYLYTLHRPGTSIAFAD